MVPRKNETKKKDEFYMSQLLRTHIYEQTIINQLNLVKATTEVSWFFFFSFKLSVFNAVYSC